MTLGRHLLIECYECNPRVLDNVDSVEAVMREAALTAGATIVQSVFHRFIPFGVSGVVVIAESHVACHTWPEHGYASVDVYTCGTTVDPAKAMAALIKGLGSGRVEHLELRRGHVDAKPT